MRLDRLPLTFDECRARFRRAAVEAGITSRAHAIEAKGPGGQALSVDVAVVGSPHPRRALVLLSGVHGVEGFIGSDVQTDLLGRLDPAGLPADVGVVMVHAVNPWGMAWGRRQNESNVDVNRNWRRDDGVPLHNDAYDEVHPLACPDTPELPSVDELMAAAAVLVAERGLPWVRDAITKGQYRHPDGLHYGGEHTEASCRIVETVVAEHLIAAESVLTLDLHTGHGPHGTVTLLSDQPPGSAQDRYLHEAFPGFRIEATADNPDATTGVKSGQIANGLGALLPAARCYASAVEFGTVPDERQLVATYLESWVQRHGDPADPAHAAIRWDYRCCFTPDDGAWEAACRAEGRRLVDLGLAAVISP